MLRYLGGPRLDLRRDQGVWNHFYFIEKKCGTGDRLRDAPNGLRRQSKSTPTSTGDVPCQFNDDHRLLVGPGCRHTAGSWPR